MTNDTERDTRAMLQELISEVHALREERAGQSPREQFAALMEDATAPERKRLKAFTNALRDATRDK